MSAGEIVLQSLAEMWANFTNFLPKLILAVILLFAGFLIAWLLEVITKKILRAIYLEEIVAKIGLKRLFEKAGLKITFTRLFAGIVYWFILIVFLAAVVNVLNLKQISDFLNKLVVYLPNVIAAVVILIIGILIANLLSNIVKNASQSANLKSAEFLGSLTKWVIFTFALLSAFVQLKIAQDLLKILFTGIVAMLTISGGLAFGLGGKDLAKDILEKLRGNISKKE